VNNLINEIFKTLLALGIVRSANNFSHTLLGRSKRHYSWILSSGHQPSLGVMLGLYARLDDISTASDAAGDTLRANTIHDLANRLWDVIRHESLIKGPHLRKKPPNGDDKQGGLFVAAPNLPQERRDQ